MLALRVWPRKLENVSRCKMPAELVGKRMAFFYDVVWFKGGVRYFVQIYSERLQMTSVSWHSRSNRPTRELRRRRSVAQVELQPAKTPSGDGVDLSRAFLTRRHQHQKK